MPYEDEPLLECASRRFVVGIISGRHDELNPVNQAPVQLLPANQVHPYILPTNEVLRSTYLHFMPANQVHRYNKG